MYPISLRDDLRQGTIYLSALAGLFRFTNAEMEQARAWVDRCPDLLVAGALQGRPVDNGSDPLLTLEPAMKLGQIVTEPRDLLVAEIAKGGSV